MKDKIQKVAKGLLLAFALCGLLTLGALAQVGNSAIEDKLDAAWQAKDTAQKVFAFRAASETLQNAVSESLATMSEIASDPAFVSDVDAEIKSEGAAILSIANAANTALASHADFIGWRQP